MLDKKMTPRWITALASWAFQLLTWKVKVRWPRRCSFHLIEALACAATAMIGLMHLLPVIIEVGRMLI